MPVSAGSTLEKAIELHQNGRLREAETIYRQLAKNHPRHADLFYLLGTAEYQRGDLEPAERHLKKAVKIQPRHAEAHNNLGLVLEDRARWIDALRHFERALSINPGYTDAHYNLANVLGKTGQGEMAVASYQRAIALREDFAEAHDNLSLVLRQLHRLEEALASSRRAVALSPRSAIAWNNLGAIHKSRCEYELAAAAFQKAVAIDESLASGWSNLGIALAHLNRFEEAQDACQQSLHLDPKSATALNNLGMTLFLQGKDEEAHAAFDRACQLDPDSTDAHNNRGSALYRLNQLDSAIEAYRTAVSLSETPVAYKNLGSVLEHRCHWDESRTAFGRASTLKKGDPLLELRAALVCPTVFESQADIAAYREQLDHALDKAIEREIRRPVEELVDFDLRPSFAWQFHGYSDRDIREKLASVFRHCIKEEAPPTRRAGPPTVGFYVSPGHEYSFCRSIGGLFAHFSDHWRPVILCSSASRARIQNALPFGNIEVIQVPIEIRYLAEAIRQLDLDMLYHWEIATSAVNYFLPMLRPTPLQCTSWGIQSTTGLKEIDHYLSSRLFEIENAQEHYTERLVKLDTLLSYQAPMAIPGRLSSRADLGLPDDRHIYLCAQQLGKFHPEFDPILSRILENDPLGEIVITASGHARENEHLRARFAKTIDVPERIRFVPKRQGDAYASLVHAADVILDPIHFGGVNTTYDALSAGRIVVSCPSALFKGRYTLGCYQRMGLSELVAPTHEAYVQHAVQAACDLEYRRHWEKQIADSRALLFERHEPAIELERWMLETIDK